MTESRECDFGFLETLRRRVMLWAGRNQLMGPTRGHWGAEWETRVYVTFGLTEFHDLG